MSTPREAPVLNALDVAALPERARAYVRDLELQLAALAARVGDLYPRAVALEAVLDLFRDGMESVPAIQVAIEMTVGRHR